MEKAWHMTLSEYQQTVTPLLKKYYKFMEKYPQYFKRADYYGLKYLTPQEFFDKEMESLIVQGYKNIATKDYIDELWSSKYSSNKGIEPDYNVPKDIIKQYEEQMKVFQEIFGEFVSKIESDETRNNKRTIRRVSETDIYVEELLDKKITPQRLQEIFDSVGLRIPKRIQEMKNKVEKKGYDRSFEVLKATRNKEFAKKVYNALGSSVQVLKDRYRNRMEDLIERWLNFDGPFYRFEDKMKDPMMTQVVRNLLDKDKNKIAEYDKQMEVLEKDYADSFIMEFVHNINYKLAKTNEDFGYPEIKINSIQFNRGRMEGTLSMKYSDFDLFVEVDVILAGGYNIQRLHERYLIKIFKDGKIINLEKLDNLKESRIQNFQEFINESNMQGE
jgi:hypothetical protein